MEEKDVLKELISMAKKDIKKIVLPESEDLRVLKAASIIQKDKIAQVILIGKVSDITNKCLENNIDISDINIQDNNTSKNLEKYANELFRLRQKKGITLDDAYELLKDKVYFATMMVQCGDSDGMVCGATHSTSDTLRPALQIIKKKEGINTVSSFFIMQTPNKNLGESGKFIFSDCGLVEYPTEDQLVDISLSSYDSFKTILRKEPKIAVLSYSTLGSAKHEKIDKLRNVVKKVRDINPDIMIDGELQLDSAIIQEVANVKAKESIVAGKANVLVFPNLEAGNIGYKIAERFGNMIALGPITQGLNKPINDLSRGCSVQDIVGVVSITCIQASN